jgi:hypothetical protein
VSDHYDEARRAAYEVRYGELVDTYTWNSAADVTLAAAAPFIAAGERERIRQRLVSCPACGEIHREDQEADHPNKAPWRPRGPNALAFLDELLGDGPLP